MHPEIGKTLVAQHRDELMRHLEASRSAARRRFPRTRTVLAPAGGAGPAGGNRAGRAGRRGSSLVIIISAYRSA
jgi:hypothetical protein